MLPPPQCKWQNVTKSDKNIGSLRLLRRPLPGQLLLSVPRPTLVGSAGYQLQWLFDGDIATCGRFIIAGRRALEKAIFVSVRTSCLRLRMSGNSDEDKWKVICPLRRLLPGQLFVSVPVRHRWVQLDISSDEELAEHHKCWIHHYRYKPIKNIKYNHNIKLYCKLVYSET